MLHISRGLTTKRCVICPRIYMPNRSMQKVCSTACAHELARRERERDEARARRCA